MAATHQILNKGMTVDGYMNIAVAACSLYCRGSGIRLRVMLAGVGVPNERRSGAVIPRLVAVHHGLSLRRQQTWTPIRSFRFRRDVSAPEHAQAHQHACQSGGPIQCT